jgi:dipeptidyl aminopeptidase/acylaminoacyl peptidase
MNRENISWKSDGLKIAGEVYSPGRRDERLPALVICHGIPAGVKGPEDRGYPLLAERFCREGFLTVIFNFRGAGSSEGNFDLLGWAQDLERGLDYLSTRREADAERIFLLGFSGGAAVAIYVAAHRNEVAGLVSCASPAEFSDLTDGRRLDDFLEHARKVEIVRDPDFPPSMDEWKKGFQAVKPIDWIDKIPPRPIFLIHGTEDEVVKVTHAQRLYQRVKGRAELFLLEGGEHRLRVDERAMEKAMEWLKKIAFSRASIADG